VWFWVYIKEGDGHWARQQGASWPDFFEMLRDGCNFVKDG
jgi:hypothetical protein